MSKIEPRNIEGKRRFATTYFKFMSTRVVRYKCPFGRCDEQQQMRNRIKYAYLSYAFVGDEHKKYLAYGRCGAVSTWRGAPLQSSGGNVDAALAPHPACSDGVWAFRDASEAAAHRVGYGGRAQNLDGA